MPSRLQLFVLSTDRSVLQTLQHLLGGKVDVVRTVNIQSIISQTGIDRPALGVFVDAASIGGEIALLGQLKTSLPTIPIALLLGEEDFALGIDAVHAGVADGTVHKPIDLEAFKFAVGQMIATRKSAAIAA